MKKSNSSLSSVFVFIFAFVFATTSHAQNPFVGLNHNSSHSDIEKALVEQGFTKVNHFTNNNTNYCILAGSFEGDYTSISIQYNKATDRPSGLRATICCIGNEQLKVQVDRFTSFIDNAAKGIQPVIETHPDAELGEAIKRTYNLGSATLTLATMHQDIFCPLFYTLTIELK